MVITDDFPPLDFRSRRVQARERLRSEAFGALVVPVSSDLEFLTGLTIKKSERPTFLFLPVEGEAVLVCPRFEKERLKAQVNDIEIRTYAEGEDAFSLAVPLLVEVSDVAISGRAWFSEVRGLTRAAPDVNVTCADPLLSPLRWYKGEAELARMGAAVNLWQDVLEEIVRAAESGVTNAELKAKIVSDLKAGGGRAPSCTVSIGPASALPHGSKAETALKEGDVLLIDGGVSIDGYRSDITRTFFFGGASRRAREVADVVLAAQEAAIRTIHPGVPAEAVDFAARKVIEAAGFGDAFTHRVGHGLGMDGHEPPYLVKGNDQPLQTGMVVTVEPGIYLEGEFGVRIEDDLLVTVEGARSLSTRVSNISALQLTP